MKTLPKPGDWVTLTSKTKVGDIRTELNGHLWNVKEVASDRLLVKSAEKTFGPKNNKTHDGMWIWLEGDPNFDWS